MNNPFTFAHLLARWNVEEFYVPDSVERAVATVPIMVGIVEGPRTGPKEVDLTGDGMVKCLHDGFSCKWQAGMVLTYAANNRELLSRRDPFTQQVCWRAEHTITQSSWIGGR